MALHDFIEHAPATIKQLVRSVDLNALHSTDGLGSGSEFGRFQREACAEILRSLPALSEASFSLSSWCWGNDDELYYAINSKIGARLRKLAIDGGSSGHSSLFLRTPNLQHLKLRKQSHLSTLANRDLGSLVQLESFELRVTSNFNPNFDPPLGAPLAYQFLGAQSCRLWSSTS